MFFIVGPIPLPCELNFLAGLRATIAKSGRAGVRIALDLKREGSVVLLHRCMFWLHQVTRIWGAALC